MYPLLATLHSGIALNNGNALGGALFALLAGAFSLRRSQTPFTAVLMPRRAMTTGRGNVSSYWEDDGIFSKPAASGGFRMAGEVWTALSAVMVAILGPWVAYKIKSRQDKDATTAFKQGLEDTSALMGHLAAFAQYGSPRTILWAGHNGGGLPAGGSPFYTSAIHHSIAPGHPNLTGSYSKLLVDSAYVQMLIDSIEHLGDAVHVSTAKMKPCQLKSYYEAEGVVNSLVIGLGIKDAKFYYISLARYEGDFDKREITLCELQARQVWSALTGAKESAK